MEISFHSHFESNRVIATKFCTWHDSCAVVACAKICRDLMASNGTTARRSFHRIWITGKKPLVKRAPEYTSFLNKCEHFPALTCVCDFVCRGRYNQLCDLLYFIVIPFTCSLSNETLNGWKSISKTYDSLRSILVIIKQHVEYTFISSRYSM